MESKDQHILNLKILRLSRPSFQLSSASIVEPQSEIECSQEIVREVVDFDDSYDVASSIPIASLNLSNSNSVTTADSPNSITQHGTSAHTGTISSLQTPSPASSQGATRFDPVTHFLLAQMQHFSTSQLLTLPGSFGNIYLGETFSSYVCLINDSTWIARDVHVKCELQTLSQKFTLFESDVTTPPGISTTTTRPSPPNSKDSTTVLKHTSTIHPAKSSETVIQHEIKELGLHSLVCSVSYTKNEEKKTFRKLYRFQVLNPLAVKTKINSLSNGDVFLEAQVHNICESSMVIERMRFDPVEQFTCHDLNRRLSGTPPPTLIRVS